MFYSGNNNICTYCKYTKKTNESRASRPITIKYAAGSNGSEYLLHNI